MQMHGKMKRKQLAFWWPEIREIAYDVEDVLEIFALRISSRREAGILRIYAGMVKESMNIHQINSEIHDIKTKILNLTRCMQTYGIRGISQEEHSDSACRRRPDLRRSYSHLVEEDFVGMEEDIENLVGNLVKEDSNCKFLGIFGMGGLGKTTLARKIYHRGDVRSHFQAFAWVCISQQWQAKDTLQGILIKLLPERREQINGMRHDELIKELYEVQLKKKCLVVLDDIWSFDFWDSLGPAFSTKNKSSRALFTTRNREVGIRTDRTFWLHEPRLLNDEEGWELLQKKSFPKNGEDIGMDVEREKLGREMVAQCGGLPLAVIALGGILMAKPALIDWKKVHRKLTIYLRKDKSLGQYGRVYEVLALSYRELPYQYRPCFLHMGSFAEDSKISTRTLNQLWAGEGFLPLESYDGEEESVMDLGEHYLGELARKFMVQVQAEETTGKLEVLSTS